MPDQTDVIIIGAGAAGLFCAGFAAKSGKRVLLLEKMERPARKLMITGKGRCNVTNECNREELLAAVRTNGKFLYSAFSAFGPKDLMRLFKDDLHVPLKTERGGRVFPASDKAVDIVDALVSFVKKSGSNVKTGVCCKELIFTDGRVAGVKTNAGDFYAGSIVVATGGKSYPLTGSDGDGYTLAKQAGHTVTTLRPSLIPVVIKEDFCRDLTGLSLKNCILSLFKKGRAKPVFSELGELLFTHFGVSGPLVLSASAHMDGDISDYTLSIDLKPALLKDQLDARILRDFHANLNKDFQNSLSELLPRKLIPVIVRLSGIPGNVKVNSITKGQRLALAGLLKRLNLTPVALRPIEEAVVTCGGVSVKEINPRTMGSKLVPGLFFAGEVIDADAYTGGFNLQIAFSTGFLAAQNV
ncbi:MAG: NAD(P)/FAD-dependent oxidoreductase [Oscillospiraceae bacterium]|nr:NAD(P)/FAD-dependent oxidoreductase [Oscillospiraceae bacterium]